MVPAMIGAVMIGPRARWLSSGGTEWQALYISATG